MRNSFLQIPRELADAARVDGASVTKSLISVYRPLVMPGIATTALYAFLFLVDRVPRGAELPHQ
jgi:multiple sugar transport system permease protein